jgi:SAM-dependent methyltransferase
MDIILNEYNNLSSENTNKNVNYELEITYHIHKNIDIYKDIFNKLKNLSISASIIENIDIFYNDNIRLTKSFKHSVNLNNDLTIRKKSLLKPFNFREGINNISSYKLKVNSEEVIKSKPVSEIKMIRLKLRISFILKDHPNFKVDLDLIKNIDSHEKHLKEIKNTLFKEYQVANIIENINYSLFDGMVLETEYLTSSVSTQEVEDSISLIRSLFGEGSNNDYQKYIFKIARYIIQNKTYLENFREKSGLKKLLNNVIEINADTYFKSVIPNITEFYVTDKIDGQRCICYIEEYSTESDNTINIKLITNKIYIIKEYNEKVIINKDTTKKVTILDCEIIFNEGVKNEDIISENDIFLYIFDIISLENEKIAFKPFQDRLPFLGDGFNKIKMLPNVNIKEYIKLTDNYKDELKEFYERKNNSKLYEIDGLIFTPSSKVKTNVKFPINTNYNNMLGYKWKNIENMTIDFFVCKLPKNLYTNIPYNKIKLEKNQNIYILFSGISKNDYHKLNMTYMIDYKKIVQEKFTNGSLFPIQFSTSDAPYNYIYLDTNDELHERVCEFNYDTKEKKWVFKKIRTDRDVELERGEYFGNYFKVSESIWNNINNPLTFDMLIGSNKGYFMQDDNSFYKSQRSYNSFVKTNMLENVLSSKLTDKNDTDMVIDMASGKGQDLARLVNLGFKKGLFIDNDKNALAELVNRKHNLRTIGNKTMKIHVKVIDLTNDYTSIIKSLEAFDIKKESVDIIICNFAIHYILSNEGNLINLIKLLNHYLKPNGRFLFTCFNGEKIFKLLKETNEWNSYENNNLKYSIKKLYKSESLSNFGQKIDVLLPFSKDTYYTEYLVNLEHVTNIFNSNNFTTEVSLPFDSLLDEFREQNYKEFENLSDSDKDYISLYQFVIVKKNQSNSIISKSNIKSLFNISGIGGAGPLAFKSTSNTTSPFSGGIQQKGNLDLIQNINSSNRILLLINTTIPTIIDNITDMFIENNYKNYYTHKKNKNKIIKVVGFEDNSYKENYEANKGFDSIIIYDKSFIYTELFNNILIKKSISPVILSDEHNKKIIILNNEVLTDIFENYNVDLSIYENIKNYIESNSIVYIHN